MKPIRFIIRYGGYAARFHTNLCRSTFTMVKDSEASQFATAEQAAAAAIHHGMPLDKAEVRLAPELEKAA